MSNFLPAYHVSMKFENGYSNLASDAGGETYFGVSRVSHPDWPGWKLIDQQKKFYPGGVIPRYTKFDIYELDKMLQTFYREQFWNRISGDGITTQQVAGMLFDWTITSHYAVRETQRVLVSDFKAQIAIDNAFGPKTLAALNEAPQRDFYAVLRECRANYYRRLDQPQNLQGWLARVHAFPATI